MTIEFQKTGALSITPSYLNDMTFPSAIIRQPCGIGDILFCLRIAEQIHKKYGCNITWPILENIQWMGEYLDCPYINWTVWDDECSKTLTDYGWKQQPFIGSDGHLVVPVDSAWNALRQGPPDKPTPAIGVIMEAKYQLVNLSHENWQDSIKIKRNIDRESSLYYDVLGLKDNFDYTFVSRLYGTPILPSKDFPYGRPAELSKFMDMSMFDPPVVELQLIPEYNIFDWLMVVEKAKRLELVSTCWVFILEALDADLPTINLHNRDDRYNLRQLDFMVPGFRKDWNFIELDERKLAHK